MALGALALGSRLWALCVRVHTFVQVCVWTQVRVRPSLTWREREGTREPPRLVRASRGAAAANREGGPSLRPRQSQAPWPGGEGVVLSVPGSPATWGAGGRQVAALAGGLARSPPLPAPSLVWGCTCPATSACLGSEYGSTVCMAGSIPSSGCWEGTLIFPGPPRQGLTALGQDSTPGSPNTRVPKRPPERS